MALRINDGIGRAQLGELGLDDAVATVVRRETKKEQPTYEDVLEASERAKGDTSAVLQAVLQSFRRQRIPATAPLIGKDGEKTATGVGIVALRAQNAPLGESRSQAAMRAFMTEACAGQPDAVEAFVNLLGEQENALRTTPPFMAVIGHPHRGQAQAIAAYARQSIGEGAHEVIELAEAGAETQAEGVLNPGLLRKRAEQVKAKVERPLVIHVRGAEALAERSPSCARALKRLLAAREGSPDYVPATFVFELGVPDTADPQAELIRALDGAGAKDSWVNGHSVRKHARFGMLDGDTMAKYADAALQDIFRETKALAAHHLQKTVDPDTRSILGRALATPFAPLRELRTRLDFLIRDRIKLHALHNPEGAVLGLQLMPDVIKHPNRAAELIEALHQPNADYSRLSELFWFAETARVDDVSRGRLEMLMRSEDCCKRLEGVREHFGAARKDAKGLRKSADAVLRRLDTLQGAIDALHQEALRNTDTSYEQLAGFQVQEAAVRAYEDAAEHTSGLVNAALAGEVDPALAAALAAVEGVLTGARAVIVELAERLPAPAVERMRAQPRRGAQLPLLRAAAEHALRGGDLVDISTAIMRLRELQPKGKAAALLKALEADGNRGAERTVALACALLEGRDAAAALEASGYAAEAMRLARAGESPAQVLRLIARDAEAIGRADYAKNVSDQANVEYLPRAALARLRNGAERGVWLRDAEVEYRAAAKRTAGGPDEAELAALRARVVGGGSGVPAEVIDRLVEGKRRPLAGETVAKLPAEVPVAKSAWPFADVPFYRVAGAHGRVDLNRLARKLAMRWGTSGAALQSLALEALGAALADPNRQHAMAADTVEAAQQLMREHFRRDVKLEAYRDAQHGVSVQIAATETPVEVRRDRTRVLYNVERALGTMTVDAPLFGRVVVAVRDAEGGWFDAPLVAEARVRGATFDLSRLPEGADKLVVFVAKEGDALEPQQLVAAVQIPVPWRRITWTVEPQRRPERTRILYR